MQSDRSKYFGSLMMFGFGVFAFYRWYQTQLLFFLLLVLRDFAAGYFFLKRTPAETKSNTTTSIISYISAAMPLFYFSSTEESRVLLLISNLLAIIGFLLVALATVELGTSIGISPAKRELVTSGIYKWVRHPMYSGYVLSEFGMTLVNPLNLVLFLISSALYYYRSWRERLILEADIYRDIGA
ncbi:MAG: hypothetical protein NDI69_06850 [Bacteriovoracaceae bacterium]|nr:hypothetical protein [Bacteriovoracaceae bacterium]